MVYFYNNLLVDRPITLKIVLSPGYYCHGLPSWNAQGNIESNSRVEISSLY
jgi:hypothetical protein